VSIGGGSSTLVQDVKNEKRLKITRAFIVLFYLNLFDFLKWRKIQDKKKPEWVNSGLDISTSEEDKKFEWGAQPTL
jgi:hypothetical protein